jgi:ADP-ribose pyrophosphatase YjhB (NUDIX family)
MVANRVQYAALPYRLSAGSRPEFMLVTSRETRRWIIPKGWPKKGKSPQHSAAREAFEEAGIVGAIAKRSVGSFSYKKRLKTGGIVVCEVRVFPLEVKHQNKQWPEKQERDVKWLSVPHRLRKRSKSQCCARSYVAWRADMTDAKCSKSMKSQRCVICFGTLSDRRASELGVRFLHHLWRNRSLADRATKCADFSRTTQGCLAPMRSIF